MMIFAPVLVLGAWAHAMVEGTIVKIESSRKFAGRLGYLVTDHVTVEAGGKTIKMTLPPHHSRSRELRHTPKVGDKIRVRA